MAIAYKIPKASPGQPEAGLQLDISGKTKAVMPKGKGKTVTASMDAFQTLQVARAEQKQADPMQNIMGTLSHEDAAELMAGLELRAENLGNRIDEGRATIETIKETLDPDVAKLTKLIPSTKEGSSEITHITKGQYKEVWGRDPKPNILTKDGKRVRWEYALDEIAQQLHLEDKARAAGIAPDEYLKNLIEQAKDTKALLKATEIEVASDESTLKALARLKDSIKGRAAKETTGPLLKTLAKAKPSKAAKPKPATRAKAMLAHDARAIIARVQSQRSNLAIILDNSKQANRIIPESKVEVWAKNPNRYDMRGVDTAGSSTNIKPGVAYADKGKQRLSRSRHKGFRKIKLA